MSFVRRRLRRYLPALALVALLAPLGAPASASAALVPLQTAPACDQYASNTDWNRTLSLPRFNPALGTLTGVTVTQSVQVRSDYRVESTDNSARTVTLALSDASVSMTVPGQPALGATLPAGTRTQNLAGFDGTVDWSGTSGTAGSFGVAPNSTSARIADPATWAGTGTIPIAASARATTNHNLSGNFRLEWDTPAEARACVTYDYSVQVLVCIGDYVWHDENQNGIQDANEQAVPGRLVSVTDSAGNPLGSATTDGNGRWTVCNLEPNTACVAAVDLPDGWTLTIPGAGPDRGADSNGLPAGADATIPCVTPPSGSDLSFDVGIHKVAGEPTSADTPVARGQLKVAKATKQKSTRSRATVAFVVTVKNAGGAAVNNVAVCDVPPAQLAFTSKPKGSFTSNGRLCWNIKTLRGGATQTFRYTMRAATVTRRTCVVNAVTAAPRVGSTGSAKASTCIQPGTLGQLLLAG